MSSTIATSLDVAAPVRQILYVFPVAFKLKRVFSTVILSLTVQPSHSRGLEIPVLSGRC